MPVLVLVGNSCILWRMLRNEDASLQRTSTRSLDVDFSANTMDGLLSEPVNAFLVEAERKDDGWV